MTSGPAGRPRTDAGLAGGAVAGVVAVLVVIGGIFLVQGNRGDGTEPLNATQSTTADPSAAEEPSDSPTSSPTDDEAWLEEVRVAAKDGFPAFVPAEVPAGWVVDDAAYEPDARWTMHFTAPSGATVTLDQVAGGGVRAVAEAVVGRSEPGREVDLRRWGTGRWQEYAGPDGLALGNDLADSAVVVAGDTSRKELVQLLKQLLTAEMVVNVGDGSDG